MSWETVTLGEICSQADGGIQTGPFGSQLHASDYVAEGIPVVMPQDIGDNVITTENIARIGVDDVSRLSRHQLAYGDIVYSRRGDVERRALVRESNVGWLCGTGCLRVRIKDQNVHDSRFISYALGLEQSRTWIRKHAVGATMLNLNTGILSAVPLSIPALYEQQAIAEVLGALDDKIAANERVAKKLDALIDALVYQIVAQGKRMMVGDILTLNYGKSLPAKLRNPGDIPVVGSGGISGYHDTYLVKNSGTVIGRKGTVGATYWVNGPHYPIDTAYFVESSLPYSNELLYRLVKTVDFTGLNSDSAVPGLNRDEAYSQPIMIPSSEQIGTISNLAASFQASISAVDGESTALARTRDELLPLLMSGKITVKDAEAIASDAV
ncbi:restriction endonuclease subunit S [Brevibacterium sp. 91QC2O2]|uniref:restriction endonuclease subunit S n=1 Tax=Brevibacterium TaxID=1696 RepID=UPI00211CA0B5|nr:MULTISPECIES: restriction endonuclease subunit S [unclassified Brevibacterium]MCQ9367138.1 restriction endonuclease subunit S [Brevibacterium sp. 91QC2O2]MCQ9385415.1 restriction endonuclease subunit S [Brevibacterium sp. 68QC2CO]